MSKTLLIYERAVPITKIRHGKHSIRPTGDYRFASEVNSLPLLAQEFRAAVREYPIVFAGNEQVVMPAVLLGFGEQDNLFVDAEGAWQAKYIPAFARRYPYVFSSSDQGKTLTLCVDEEYAGLNTEGEGERLFTDDGEQTEYLNGVLEFQKEFQAAFQRTQVFCKRLMDLELLEPMQAQMKFGSGEEKSIAGFQTVNRDKVKALDADTLAELVKVDELELIYLHLHSMQNITEVAGQVSAAAADEMASDTASTNKKKAASK